MSTANRSLKPYPPAGVSLVDTSLAGGGLAISWKNRNRTILTIRKQSDPTETLEVGQTTTIRIYNEVGTLIRTVTGQTGTSYTYDDLTEIADAGALQNELTVKLKSIRDGYESLDATVVLERTQFVLVGTDHVVVGTDRVIL